MKVTGELNKNSRVSSQEVMRTSENILNLTANYYKLGLISFKVNKFQLLEADDLRMKRKNCGREKMCSGIRS